MSGAQPARRLCSSPPPPDAHGGGWARGERRAEEVWSEGGGVGWGGAAEGTAWRYETCGRRRAARTVAARAAAARGGGAARAARAAEARQARKQVRLSG